MPVECGGSGSEAVYFDNDYKQSPRHVRKAIERRIREQSKLRFDEAAVERLTSETMARVKMRRCATTLEFLATLELLVNDDDNRPPPTLCVLDSLAAFFWRWEDNDGAPSLAPAILRALARLDATIVAAKPVLFKKQPGASSNCLTLFPRRRYFFLSRRRIHAEGMDSPGDKAPLAVKYRITRSDYSFPMFGMPSFMRRSSLFSIKKSKSSRKTRRGLPLTS